MCKKNLRDPLDSSESARERQERLIAAVVELGAEVSVAEACRALGVPRATFYRHRKPVERPAKPRPKPARALNEGERQQVLDVLHQERFMDKAPAEVYARLLDEGKYLCSIRTMYRILEAADEVRERRNQVRHPAYTKPELLATAPNQVWSWDITKLKGPRAWQHYNLYVIMDIFSRYVVGWMVAERASESLAQRLIAETLRKQGIQRDQLVIHADRGAAMCSKPVAQLLADRGVTKTHSRPHTSNDNPFSEAQFKTLKYRRTSLSASAPWRTHEPFAAASFAGITASTTTAALHYLHPKLFTSARLMQSSSTDLQYWTQRMRPIQSGLSAGSRHTLVRLPRPG